MLLQSIWVLSNINCPGQDIKLPQTVLYTFRPMFEALLATALMVGNVEIGPGIYQEQYITVVDNVPVLVEFESDVD